MTWVVVIIVAVPLAYALFALFVLIVSFRETDGVGYFGRPLAERRAMKQRLARRARWIDPALRAAAAIVRAKRLRSCEYKGVRGPAFGSSSARFAATERFEPEPGDVFVATQMKCGTTWMQQLAYEVLCRGNGNFGDDGHVHLYAASPWIESRGSVSMADAARLGERGVRLIKTHMPTLLCPFSERARYLYVARHPVACFASCVDFIRMLAGPLTPPLPELLDWYCSGDMWWRPWPEHVEGWWRWAQERSNVLFVHYEEMLDDLPGVAGRVARHLDVDLGDAELARVVEKSRFEFMKAHEECFEMSPPSPLTQTGGAFLKGGTRARERDVGEVERERILAYCRERLAYATYPAERFYPELAQPSS